MPELIIRPAVIEDLKVICDFTDFWLAGRGCRCHAQGAVNDYFISPSQHRRYILRYKTFLAHLEKALVGWAVIQTDGSLIHLLISGFKRNQGFGSKFLELLKPHTVHSKSDQSTGNPEPFYVKNGYRKIKSIASRSRIDIDKIKPNRPKNIDIFERQNCEKVSEHTVKP